MFVQFAVQVYDEFLNGKIVAYLKLTVFFRLVDYPIIWQFDPLSVVPSPNIRR